MTVGYENKIGPRKKWGSAPSFLLANIGHTPTTCPAWARCCGDFKKIYNMADAFTGPVRLY